MSLLKEEFVLVQAWKKAAGYIRAHNWYTDTLELDRATVDLPRVLGTLMTRLSRADEWSNEPLRIVPAPKAQRWRIKSSGGRSKWRPVDTDPANKLRPLAHVAFSEQVITTAVMLCLADRVETLQGDPRLSPITEANRKRVLSYGNRLFCDGNGGTLHHRWGTAKLYRAYFADYQTFVTRPEITAREYQTVRRLIVVHSDLKQFYDRVTPDFLHASIDRLRVPDDDAHFFDFAKQVLRWGWHPQDAQEVALIAEPSGLGSFSAIALPQGLVASGFFANVVLMAFDRAMLHNFGVEIFPGGTLIDACRYVDDLRFVVEVDPELGLNSIEKSMCCWIQTTLDATAPGLVASLDKTTAATAKEDERPVIRQSRKMRRIQEAISGGFDAIAGADILSAIQGLLTAQQGGGRSEAEWPYAPVPDVRDATVERFAAARYRATYRSLRPLLESSGAQQSVEGDEDEVVVSSAARTAHPRSQAELDDDVRAFALGLIDRWIADPSNVRLLRIGLDLWPAEYIVRNVFDLLRPLMKARGVGGPVGRRIAWYCLSEIFRAGATETGLVDDSERLPDAVDVAGYRKVLLEEAYRILSAPRRGIPWYLKQQVLLYIAVLGPVDERVVYGPLTRPETDSYSQMLRYLSGAADHLGDADFAIAAILARRSYRPSDVAIDLARGHLTPSRLAELTERDPVFADELVTHAMGPTGTGRPVTEEQRPGQRSRFLLLDLVRRTGTSTLRDELSLLSFAAQAILALAKDGGSAVPPSRVLVEIQKSSGISQNVLSVAIMQGEGRVTDVVYKPPSWCPAGERWRFKLGFLLRYILTASSDVFRYVKPVSWRERLPVYRTPETHWYQRMHGSFNGAAGFGDDWVPISPWTEGLLSALLAWPGTLPSNLSPMIDAGPEAVHEAILKQIERVRNERGRATGVLVLPVAANWLAPSFKPRPLRGCVVQTVVPEATDFIPDPTLSSSAMRKRHRNHLSASLSAVDKMLELRSTHHSQRERLDLLILPELAVHRADVITHLVPFARAHKTIVLAGLVYEDLNATGNLVNSAIWVIPQRTPAGGVSFVTRRQGKWHLAALEKTLSGSAPVVPFRPCQWIVNYEWSVDPEQRPLHLTASICYDATDLCLTSDMRSSSDVYLIPALNQDINTFDQMALALHYHMFQLVVVANNGGFGGSNAYAPYREPYRKQIFHLHGQPQASIAFFELEDVGAFIQRKEAALASTPGSLPDWKYPPAGI